MEIHNSTCSKQRPTGPSQIIQISCGLSKTHLHILEHLLCRIMQLNSSSLLIAKCNLRLRMPPNLGLPRIKLCSLQLKEALGLHPSTRHLRYAMPLEGIGVMPMALEKLFVLTQVSSLINTCLGS